MAQQLHPNEIGSAPVNYRELYSQVGYQANEPEPARLVASYRFTEVAGGGERPTPANLKEQTFVVSERRPMTFLCLLRKPNSGVEVRILHRMMRYVELPGDRGLVDLSMALLGDVRAAQMPVVELDNSHFSLIGAGVRVPTAAAMPDHLAAAPPGTYLGPYGPEVPGTEVVRPRMTQVLPTKYAATLIHRDGVSPSTTYQELSGMFAADGVLDACADVLSWLRVACTVRGGAGDLAAIPAVAQSFDLLLLQETASDYVAAKVYADLGGRPHGGGGPAGGMDQVMTVVQQLAANVAEAGSRSNREPKGVMEAYRETYPVLLRYCQVATVDELAPIWSRLARGTKGEQHSIIQQEMTKVCGDRGLTPDLYCPAITTGLKQMVTSLNFAGNGPDDLTAGCQPFLVAYTTQNDHYRALDDAMVANQLDQGTANASLSDIRDIRAKERIKLPRDLNQVSLTLRRFAILVHTLFQGTGASNPFVRCMWLLSNKFHDRLPHYLGQHQALTGTPWAEVYPAHVLRHVQINVYEYLQALQVGNTGALEEAALEPPSFQELHRDLQRGCFHMSSSWLPLPASVTVDPTHTTNPPVGGGTRTTRASTAASTTSGLTSATGGGRASAGATSGATSTQGAYVPNPARDAEFDSLQLRPQMRDLLRAHPPPTNDAGNEFCVSWWGRGGCYSNCGRASTHRPFATTAERTRLLAHVRTHLVVPTPAAAVGERGPADIAASVGTIPHKAARLLAHLRRRGAGVPLHTGPWPLDRILDAAKRGSHRSARDETEFVCAEMLEFCAQGFWTVLPLSAALVLPNLRLSPLGVVPQRDRRSRLIVDYTYSGVNDETARLAPPEAMQFGKALQRYLTRLVHADPTYGPVFMAKIDIADGFYRIGIRHRDIPRLGVILPTTCGEPLVAFPLALPMGWVESPPYFTAVTETACDLLNASLQRWDHPPAPHRLEYLAATPPSIDVTALTPTTQRVAPCLAREGSTDHRATPLAYGDVYVDDFILAAQTKRHQQRVMRSALHAIDQVFRPLSPTDHPSRKEPVSVKKLRQGDACWSTRHTILGWHLDTVAGTLNLPPHRLARLYALLDEFPMTRRRVPVAKWHQLLGELRSMATALPGARGLFSTLQDALRTGDRHRVRLGRRVFDSLADFRAIADSLRARPTRFRELVPFGAPVARGACDACQRGMGGVWFLPDAPPILWRSAFPLVIQQSLVTSDNRGGSLSISDLELAGTIAHKHVLVQASRAPLAERPIWLAGDNRASLAWATKGSATASTARAYLLRLNALHQRHYRYVPQHDYIAGKANVMADDASHILDVTNPCSRDAIRGDWSAITATLLTHQSAHRGASSASTGRVWERFCAANGLRPDLQDLPGDPVPVLLLFAHQYRTGRLAPSRPPVRSRTVEDAVRHVAQAFTRVGAVDPRLNAFGDLDFRLQSLFQAWKRADPPPLRVKPVPLSVIRQAHSLVLTQPPASRLAATGDCLLLAYYFLLRPGEYSGTPRTDADDLFRFQDVGLMIGHRRLDPLTCPIPDLLAASFVTLTFTSQKNGVRGETIGHGRSGHPTLCPVHALVRRVLHLRAMGAAATTPLNAYRHPPSAGWHFVLPGDITTLLRRAVALIPHSDLDAGDFSARCTRAGGAMALLCGGIGSDRIRLIGRWRSDEIYRYLHVQAQPVMAGVAAAMLRGGDFRLNPPPFSTTGIPPSGPPFPPLAPLANGVPPPVHE